MQMIGNEQIINYFQGCALNLKNDGSEDSSIHCFKENQPWPAGAALLKESIWESITSESDIEEENASFNLLDEDEEEMNKIIL